MTDFTLRFLLVVVGFWLSELFIKPIVAKYPAVDLVVDILLMAVVLYIVVSQAIQIRRKIKLLEPERRQRYLRRNGVLVLFLVLLIGFASWQMFFR